jgi:hypothetical protein
MGGGVMNYSIEVDVTVTRTYTVEADSPGEAMTRYRSGDAEMDDGELDTSNWDEDERTAQVVTVTIGDTDAFYSVLDVPACAHHGENCDGAEFCCYSQATNSGMNGTATTTSPRPGTPRWRP